ncbi:unnamed protein product [Parajaminaea phylloscopi]
MASSFWSSRQGNGNGSGEHPKGPHTTGERGSSPSSHAPYLQQHPYQSHHQQQQQYLRTSPPSTPQASLHSHPTHPPPSPPSSQSSPYVSPRPIHQSSHTSDVASTQIPPLSSLLRRGAVSGASGPLSFPPLPVPFRHASAGPGDGSGLSRSSAMGQAYEQGPHGNMSSSSHFRGSSDVMSGARAPYGTAFASTPSSSSSPSASSAHSWPAGRLPPFASAASPSTSVLTPTSTSGNGPHFPLPSSYSLSSMGATAMTSEAMPPRPTTQYHHDGIASSSPPSIGAQRRGGLSASSGTGVYGAAALVGAHPYWGASGVAANVASGFKRKQTSANPPPRNYACPSCPASFSRRHDLNRHSRIHLAVKPFACPNCQKTFSRKDALKRHLMVKGCGKDAEGRPRKRRGRKSAAEKAAGEEEGSSSLKGEGTEDISRSDGGGNSEGDGDNGNADYDDDDDDEEEEEDGGEDAGQLEPFAGDVNGLDYGTHSFPGQDRHSHQQYQPLHESKHSQSQFYSVG